MIMQRRDADNCRGAGRYSSLHTAKGGQRHVPADPPLELVKIGRSGSIPVASIRRVAIESASEVLEARTRDQASRSRRKR
jgi:hypothetical protein